MPVGGGAFEVVGWMFSARDLASSVVVKAAQAVDAASGSIEHSLDVASATIEKSTAAIGTTVGASMDFVAQSFSNVFSDAFSTAWGAGSATLGAVEAGFSTLGASVVGGLAGASESVTAFGSSVATGFNSALTTVDLVTAEIGVRVYTTFHDTIPAALGQTWTYLNKTKFSFGDIGTAAGVMKDTIADGFGALVSALPGVADGAKRVGSRLFQMGRDAASSSVQVGSLLSGLLSVGSAQAGGAGGIGAMAGGFGRILGLLTPIINLLQTVFQPLIDGISDHLQNALGPLQMVMEMIAQDLGPKIGALITPFVTILTIIVSQLGQMLSTLLDTGPVLGTITQVTGLIAGMAQRLMPVVMRLAEAFAGVFAKILPIVLGLFEALLPIVELVVTLLADTLTMALGEIGKILDEVGPLLIETFVQLLDALKPLLPSLVKLVGALLQIAAPFIAAALIGILKVIQALIPALTTVVGWATSLSDWFSGWVTSTMEELGGFETFVLAFKMGLDNLFETIGGWIDALAGWMIDAYDAVMHFWSGSGIKNDVIVPLVTFIPRVVGGLLTWIYGNLTRAKMFAFSVFETIFDRISWYFTDFVPEMWLTFWRWAQGLGVEFLTWLDGIVGTIFDALGLTEIGEGARGVIQAAIGALMAPVETIRGLINDLVIDNINALLSFQLPYIGPLNSLIGLDPIPRLAAGGVTTTAAEQRGGVTATVGEAGRELILPLQPRVIQDALAPAFDGIELPGLDQVLAVLVSIDRRLGGTLKTDGGRRERSGPSAAPSGSFLGVAVGMGGI